jgi:hypothetical protein
MNLLADEGVERQIVERLRQDGHTVLYIAEMEPSAPDDVVLERANEIMALDASPSGAACVEYVCRPEE